MTKAEQQARDYAAERGKEKTLPVREAEAPRTVRVRIAVALNASGNYAVAGWARNVNDPDEDDVVMDDALDLLGTRSVAHRWIEADIPFPAAQTIRGEVTP